MSLVLPRRLALAALFGVPVVTHAQWIDYAQADTSSSATTAVVVSALGPTNAASPAPLITAGYTRWSSGQAAGIGAVYRWALTEQPHQWLVGAGLGVNSFRNRGSNSEEDEAAIAGRAQSEWFGPAWGGNYYALAQAATFRQTWLATATYMPGGGVPVAPEWTRYHERGYQATTLGLRISVGVPRWFLRVGVTSAEGETHPYIGVAYNAF